MKTAYAQPLKADGSEQTPEISVMTPEQQASFQQIRSWRPDRLTEIDQRLSVLDQMLDRLTEDVVKATGIKLYGENAKIAAEKNELRAERKTLV